MPNWCRNKTTFTFPTNRVRDLFFKSIADEKLFSTFAPLNLGEDENGEEKWEFTKAIEVWGTKCEPLDVIIHRENIQENVDSELIACISFDTAWAPPTGLYERMNKNHGISIMGFFSEPGEEVFGTCIYIGDIEKNKYYNYPRNITQLQSIREYIGIDSELDLYMSSEWEYLENRWKDRDSCDSLHYSEPSDS
jgi:hypothetical protein